MEVTIHRKKKHEAEQAISDLLQRGYYISYPLTEKTMSGYTRGKFNYTKSRYTSMGGTTGSVWFAKMRRDEHVKGTL